MLEPELQKKIIIISAPSGTGKSTISKEILTSHQDIRFSISTTTRKPRTGEVHGNHYYFCTQNEFEDKIDNGDFLEWAKVFQNYYGTTKQAVYDTIKEGNFCLLDIDVQGTMSVINRYPFCKTIFILPPSLKELQRRLTNRGDTKAEEVELRLKTALEEMKYIPHYQYYVINDTILEAVKKIETIIYQES